LRFEKEIEELFSYHVNGSLFLNKLFQLAIDQLTEIWYHNRLPCECKLLNYKE